MSLINRIGNKFGNPIQRTKKYFYVRFGYFIGVITFFGFIKYIFNNERGLRKEIKENNMEIHELRKTFHELYCEINVQNKEIIKQNKLIMDIITKLNK